VCVFGGVHAVEDNGELVAAEPGRGVRAAYRIVQPLITSRDWALPDGRDGVAGSAPGGIHA
jgi:hypothetical protein